MNEITTGELSRRMDGLERHIDGRFDRLHKQIADMQFVPLQSWQLRNELVDERFTRNEARIEQLEERNTWLSRALVMAVIVAILIPAISLIIFGIPV